MAQDCAAIFCACEARFEEYGLVVGLHTQVVTPQTPERTSKMRQLKVNATLIVSGHYRAKAHVLK